MALGQVHRVQHRKELRNELFCLKRQAWESENEKIIRRATTRAPDPYACHRERWCGVMGFLYQRDRDYCIGIVPSRWDSGGVKLCGAGGRYPSAESCSPPYSLRQR